MFCEATLIRLARPMPPTLMVAMLRLSLGGTKPRPRTWRGTMVNAAVAAACERNFRRGMELFAVMGSLCGEESTTTPVEAAEAHRGSKHAGVCGLLYFPLRTSFGVTSHTSWPLGGDRRFSSTKAIPAFFIEVMWCGAPTAAASRPSTCGA